MRLRIAFLVDEILPEGVEQERSKAALLYVSTPNQIPDQHGVVEEVLRQVLGLVPVISLVA